MSILGRIKLRFSLRSVLVAVAVIAALLGVYQWIYFPYRTLSKFYRKVDLGQLEEADAMIDFRPDLAVSSNSVASQLREYEYVQPRRGVVDLLTARMTVYDPDRGSSLLIRTTEGFDHRRTDSITVVRGRIVYAWCDSLMPESTGDGTTAGLRYIPKPQ